MIYLFYVYGVFIYVLGCKDYSPLISHDVKYNLITANMLIVLLYNGNTKHFCSYYCLLDLAYFNTSSSIDGFSYAFILQ